jgi:hypothetical protein
MLRDSSDDDEGIISVLENRAREIVNQRVEEKPLTGSFKKHLLEDVNNDVEQEGGQGIALPKATPTLDPPPRNPIKENHRLARVVEALNPSPPELRETFGHHNTVEGVPADRIEGLTKIELENRGRGTPLVTSLDQIGGVDKVFSNGPPGDEPRLVRVDEERDKILKAKGQALRVNLKATILEGDRPKIVRPVCPFLFGKEDDIGLVYGAKVRGEVVEPGQRVIESVFNKIPVSLEKGRTETIRARAGVIIHREKGRANFFEGEGANEGGSLGRI